MPKEEWGTKRICPTTGKRFYDLGRDPIVSPYTGEVVSLETGKASRSIAAETPAKAKAKKPKAAAAGAVAEGDDDAEVALTEDDSEVDLGDDVLEEEEDSQTVSLDDLADVDDADEDG